MTDDAGRRYEGEWHDGRQHGTGRMMYTNRRRSIRGKWRAGVPHGKGQLTNKGGAVAVGVWIDGKRQTHWLKEPAMRLWSRLDLRRHLRTHFGQLALLMMTVHIAKNWIGPFVAYYLGKNCPARRLARVSTCLESASLLTRVINSCGGWARATVRKNPPNTSAL